MHLTHHLVHTVCHQKAQERFQICTHAQAEKNIAVSYNAVVCFKIQLGPLSGTLLCSLDTALEADLTSVINLSSCLWHCIEQH